MSLTVFLADYSAATDVVAALRSHFDSNTTPAVTLVGVSGLEGNCRVRMDAIATHDSQVIKRFLPPDIPMAAGARCHAVRAHDVGCGRRR